MSESDRGELSQDVVFDLLSSARRRFVLYYLRQTDEPVELGELADQVAAWENDTSVDDLTSQQRKRVYVSLYQTHIPKLESVGIIEYDSDSGLVELSSRAGEIGRFLGETEERPWQLYYLGLAIVSSLFYAAVTFDVAAFATVSEAVAGVVVLAAFVVLAAAHLFYARYARESFPMDLVDVDR